MFWRAWYGLTLLLETQIKMSIKDNLFYSIYKYMFWNTLKINYCVK